MVIIMQMERYNPWWRGEEDYTYQRWEESPVRWTPKETWSLSLKPFSLNFLYGPRQVGKTTLVKLLIHHLLKEGRMKGSPYSVFYFSCDELTDHKELGEVLDSYMSARDARHSAATSFLFLDEVTFVRDWWRAIKSRIDSGLLMHDVVTVTASASLKLLRQAENFPGRRGGGSDVILRPLGFRSYCKALSGPETVAIHDLSRSADVMRANEIHSESLGSLFGKYLETGGFPLPIMKMAESSRADTYDATSDPGKALLDGLRGDWLRAGKSEKFMKEVIGYVISARGTPLSWLSVSKATSIGSPHTSRTYVETLEDLLLATELELIRPDGRVEHRKNRKIHLTDPFVYKTLADYCGVPGDEAALVEATVASHLERRGEPVYFWRNGSEVDIVALEGGGSRRQCGLEVKWGFKKGARPRHIKDYVSLDRKTVPIFLASLPFA